MPAPDPSSTLLEVRNLQIDFRTRAGVAHVAHLSGLIVGYLYLKGGRGPGLPRFGRFGVRAEIKYRYLQWKMGRLRRKFRVLPGRDDWDGTIH